MGDLTRLNEILNPDTNLTPPTRSMPSSIAGLITSQNRSPNDSAKLSRALAILDSMPSRNRGSGDPNCPICGGRGAVIVTPNPESEDSRPRYERCACALDELHAQWLASSGIPPRYRGQSFATFAAFAGADQQAAAKVKRWVQRGGPDSLILFGEAKRGKTTLATIAEAERITRGQRGWFTGAADLLAEMKSAMGRTEGGSRPSEILDRARTGPLLVLDDLGAEQLPRDASWVEETLYRLINYRHDYLLPTLITTNLGVRTGKPFTELLERIGERTAWRLSAMCGEHVIRVRGGER